MKIVLISFIYEPEIGGGAAVVVNQLAHLLVQCSHTVAVITTWRGSFVKTDHTDGIKVIRIPSMNLYWIGEKDRQNFAKKYIWQLVDIWNPLVFRLVRQILINENADIVHSHKLRGLSPSIWSAAAHVGVEKICHTCHDFELAQEQNLLLRPYQILRKYFSRGVNAMTAPSRFVLDYHKKMGFFSLAKTIIIPNSHGNNASELKQNISDYSTFRKKDSAMRFLYLGRLDEAKGIDILCQAFLRIAIQKQDFILRIAGSGPLENSLREKYKYQQNIIFTGSVFGTQKTELLRDSDVLVAPSVVPESFGIVIVEAYAQGLPVIASKVGAYPEIIREGETGFLVEPVSEDGLFLALEKISCECNLLNEISRNCFDEAQKYTTDNLIHNYLDLYGCKP
jgi:glycosyltransferase involved in cell wall biosynthesis